MVSFYLESDEIVFKKYEFSSVIIGFFKVKMNLTSSKTLEATQICKFDRYNMIFLNILLDFVQIVRKKQNFLKQIIKCLN